MSDLFVAEPRGYYTRLPPLVVDCSVLAAFYFEEPDRLRAAQSLDGRALFAPFLIDHEMANVAKWKAEAGEGRIAKQGLELLASARLARCKTNVVAQWELAMREGLSGYDAAYLQLALELNAPLVTFDRVLGVAADRVLSGR